MSDQGSDWIWTPTYGIEEPPKNLGKTLPARRFESYAVQSQCTGCGEFTEILKSIGTGIRLCRTCANNFTWNQLHAAGALTDIEMAKAVRKWEQFFHE